MLFFSNTIKTRRLGFHIIQACVLIGLALSAVPAFSANADKANKSQSGRNQNATIKQANISQLKNKQTVLSFTLDRPVKYKVFALKKPDRIVIDLDGTNFTGKLAGKRPALLKNVRHATRNANDLRIVLDLKQSAKPKATMKGRQLTIALHTQVAKLTKPTESSKAIKQKKPIKKKKPKRAPATVPTRPRRGDFIVAIDAGHGGKDPGASGAHGTREKDVVLQIAKRLKNSLDRVPGIKGVLIRDGDYYVPLRKRMQIARSKKADLFVSIHADANPNRHLTGSSVYILSQNGASSEAARWLASSENSYESKLAGTSLNGKDNTLASMLMDLSQAATIDSSLTLAKNTLRELGQVTKLLHRDVESAAFVVLKSPDIPSMLVETAFISNPTEEKRLNTSHYQNKLANAVLKGIKRFKVAHAPGGRLNMYASSESKKKKSKSSKRLAKKSTRNKKAKKSTHVVRSGESLSVIAEKYGVKLNTLSLLNSLNSSTIHIGQKIYIPKRS